MFYYEVIPTKVFRKGEGFLTYGSREELRAGQVVVVPLGKSSCLGVVYRKVSEPSFKTREVLGVVYEKELPGWMVGAARWLAEYYLVELPQVMNLMLPKNKSKNFRKKELKVKDNLLDIRLNEEQRRVVEEIRGEGRTGGTEGGVGKGGSGKRATRLLRGVTGSGKTNIYLALAREQVEKGRSVILLVPEIALTSQLTERFREVFGERVRLIHSKQTAKTRREMFEQILYTEEAQVVIGPRSALFAPVARLGLIIVDEAHEATYFQEQAPKYSAVRLASYIAATEKITCLLGTATPLAVDYYMAERYGALVTLTKKAKETAIKPEIKVVDFKEREEFSKNRYFSRSLIREIEENLERGYQTLIFHNRRGSAPLTICEGCGWQALCAECFLPMTLHMDKYRLECHTCGREEEVPKACPECGHAEIIHKGFGTKLLETEVKRLFPKAKVARFDADNGKTETLAAMYDEVARGEVEIIVGTQTVAKGLDLPKLATVGVVQADAGLSLPDYVAEEKTFQLLTQVIGRVGRGHIEKAKVIIQTYQPENPVILAAMAEDYEKFYNYVLGKRGKGGLPPYRYIAKVAVTYKTEAATLRNIQKVRGEILGGGSSEGVSGGSLGGAGGARSEEGVEVSVAMPAFHERTSSGYTWQVILKARSREKLARAIAKVAGKKGVHFTIDPPSLL